MPDKTYRPTEHHFARGQALDEAGVEQARLRAVYGDLYDELLATLFRHDPIGINFEENTDEYAPEVRTILPRLPEAGSAADVGRIVREEFARWFGDDIALREDRVARYDALAADVWAAWQSR